MKKIALLCTAFLTLAFATRTHAQWNLTGNSNATGTSILGTTNAIPLNLTTNNISRLVIDANGKIGIATAPAISLLTMKGAGSTPAGSWISSGAPLFAGLGEGTPGNADFNLMMASATVNARGVIGMKRARGTLSAPAAVVNNDQLGSMLVSGFDGTNFQGAAAVDFFADGTPSAGNVPVRISFVTGSNGGNRAERLKIGNTGDITMNNNQLFVQRATGNVGIGNILPQAKLDVTGNVKITDGTQGAGKVLTSDANGLASWAVPSANPWTVANNDIVNNNIGNVGIGSVNPAAKLDVLGNVKISDGTQGKGKVLTSDANGFSSWQAIPATVESDPKVGASALNKIPKWNGSTLTDGSITDNGNVGIGETNPQGRLHVSEPFAFSGVTFSGTGLNDLTANVSGYTGTGTTTYIIRIQNAGPDPNLIEISNDGGVTFGSPVAISNPVILANSVTATFAATNGHTFGDQWTFTAGPSFIDALVVKNGKTGIGTANPTATLHIAGNVKIADGTQGNGKVLISDSTGNASWQNAVAIETDPKVGSLTNNKIPKWKGSSLTNGIMTDTDSSIGIGTSTPNASAALHVASTFKGVLFPQVSIDSLKDVTSITNPANGLVVYNTTQPGVRNDMSRGYYYFNGLVGTWVRLTDNLNDNQWESTGLNKVQLRSSLNNVSIEDTYSGVTQNYSPKTKILRVLDSSVMGIRGNIPVLVLTGVQRKTTAGWGTRPKTSIIFENNYTTSTSSATASNVSISSYVENAGTTSSTQSNGLAFYVTAPPHSNAVAADTPSVSMFRHNVGIGTYVTDINNVTEGRLQVTGFSNGDQMSLRHPSSTNLKWGLYVSSIDSSLNFYSNGSLRSNIDRVTGVYSALSDRNLKKNIETLQPILPIINKLTPYIYNYTDSRDGDRKAIGFMAQDVEPYFPDLVFNKRDRVTGEPFKMMTYQSFGVIAIKAIQEQQVQIAEKDARLKTLEEKTDNQQKQIDELKDALMKLAAQKSPCTTSK